MGYAADLASSTGCQSVFHHIIFIRTTQSSLHLSSLMYEPYLVHWYSFFQFFKPIQDNYDFWPWGAPRLVTSILDHQEPLAIGCDGVLRFVIRRIIFSFEENFGISRLEGWTSFNRDRHHNPRPQEVKELASVFIP
jgi:hypothetical protein